MYPTMSSNWSGVKVIWGIVSCGARNRARSEYSVIEGFGRQFRKCRCRQVRPEPAGANAVALGAPLFGQQFPGSNIGRATRGRGELHRQYDS